MSQHHVDLMLAILRQGVAPEEQHSDDLARCGISETEVLALPASYMLDDDETYDCHTDYQNPKPHKRYIMGGGRNPRDIAYCFRFSTGE